MNAADHEQKRKRRRSIIIAWGLVAMVVFFFALTVFKLGGNVLNRAL